MPFYISQSLIQIEESHFGWKLKENNSYSEVIFSYSENNSRKTVLLWNPPDFIDIILENL